MGKTMRHIYLYFFIFVSQLSYALERVNLDYELSAILHNESEKMRGHARAPKDTNSFSSLYLNLLTHYNIYEDTHFSLGAKTNQLFYTEGYNNIVYKNGKPYFEDIDTSILSEASLNYDNGLFALSLGRQNVQYDWLLGSIDGILAMIGSDDTHSLRLFWFDNYRHLQYNYYTMIKDINDNRGMYGLIAKSNFDNLEISYFDYYLEDLRNIAGAHINYIYDNIGFNVSYSLANALSLALYDYDESFFNASIEYLYENHFFEVGYSKTGKNGLLAILQLGNFMFGQFYLGNQEDRENAQNSFVKYIYADGKWRFELIGGVTRYDNNFVRVENDLKSKELDIYLQYNYSKNLSFDIGAMRMNVSKNDPLQVSQTLLMLNMAVNYESY